MTDELTPDPESPDDEAAPGDATAIVHPAGTADGGELSAETLTSQVHKTFAKNRRWGDVSVDLVREIVQRLDLLPEGRTSATPRLRVQRLRFTGEKTLTGEPPAPIAYDQRFQPGVNVLLVQDNSVGKSSVMKTIKFALTGDDGDYDGDVRSWISAVWLHFTIGDAPHTIHLRRADDRLVGFIAAEHVDAELSAVEAAGIITIARLSGTEGVRDGLHAFFLDRFGLGELGWTHKAPGAAAAEERRITWRTYFQALVIPDSSEGYLLLDDTHAIGNQEGLLLSTLLGLHLAQPINALLLESQKSKSETKVSEDERKRAEAEAVELEDQRAQLSDELQRITLAQEARRGALTANPDARRLRDLSVRQGERIAERIHLQRRRDNANTQAQRARARARSLRETAELQLHFTGLAVAVCPNCDTDVDAEAVERERHQHHCRLCGKEAHAASPEDVEALTAEAAVLDEQAAAAATVRDDLAAQLRLLDEELEQLDADVQSANAVLHLGPEYALPTPDEQARRDALLEQMGELRARIAIATATAARSKAGGGDAGLRAEIQQRVRKALQDAAERLNASVLDRLNGITQALVTRIGAESITDVTCSALGALSLRKHSVKVRFSSVNNPGERLRVKLAFFLAMMRLGRVKGAGRHPGFLMIDQPGSDEMVDADFEALARVLREIDQEYADEVQILCFTARPQFAAATAPEKVYGAKAGPHVF